MSCSSLCQAAQGDLITFHDGNVPYFVPYFERFSVYFEVLVHRTRKIESIPINLPLYTSDSEVPEGFYMIYSTVHEHVRFK